MRSVVTLVSLVLLAAACGGSDSTSPGQVTETDPCEGHATGPTTHSGSVSTDQTWTRCASPHVVSGMLDVRASGNDTATLTIEAGATVRMEDDAWFRVGYQSAGNVKVTGTAADTVKFIASGASPAKGAWRGFELENLSAGSEFHYATLHECGGAPSNVVAQSCIQASGINATPASLTVVVDHVTIWNSGSAGVSFLNDAGFGTGSTGVTVIGATTHPVVIAPEEAASLPAGGTYTGNARNEILLYGNHGSVRRSAAWINPGIPYRVPELGLGSNAMIDVAGPAAPTLTIAAGTRFIMEHGTEFRVGYLEPGKLVMNGTAASPVTLVSAAATPANGDYVGMTLFEGSGVSELHHVTMSHCGMPGQGHNDPACISVFGVLGTPASNSALLDNVTVSNSGSSGVSMIYDAAFAAGSTNLTVRDGSGYAVTIRAEEANSLPAGSTYTGNTLNMIELTDGEVSRTQSWINPGVPFAFECPTCALDIDARAAAGPYPTLTLAPGTTIRMTENSMVRIGYFYGGALVAPGTAAAPITFTSDQAVPTPGYWRGIVVADEALGTTRFDHVVVEYAGGFQGYSPGDDANILFAKDIGLVVTNSTIRNSAKCGITRAVFASNPGFATDFVASGNNTFSGNARANQCGPY